MNITETIDQALMDGPPEIGLAARQEPVGFWHVYRETATLAVQDGRAHSPGDRGNHG
jgi:hypothetical protein